MENSNGVNGGGTRSLWGLKWYWWLLIVVGVMAAVMVPVFLLVVFPSPTSTPQVLEHVEQLQIRDNNTGLAGTKYVSGAVLRLTLQGKRAGVVKWSMSSNHGATWTTLKDNATAATYLYQSDANALGAAFKFRVEELNQTTQRIHETPAITLLPQFSVQGVGDTQHEIVLAGSAISATLTLGARGTLLSHLNSISDWKVTMDPHTELAITGITGNSLTFQVPTGSTGDHVFTISTQTLVRNQHAPQELSWTSHKVLVKNGGDRVRVETKVNDRYVAKTAIGLEDILYISLREVPEGTVYNWALGSTAIDTPTIQDTTGDWTRYVLPATLLVGFVGNLVINVTNASTGLDVYPEINLTRMPTIHFLGPYQGLIIGAGHWGHVIPVDIKQKDLDLLKQANVEVGYQGSSQDSLTILGTRAQGQVKLELNQITLSDMKQDIANPQWAAPLSFRITLDQVTTIEQTPNTYEYVLVPSNAMTSLEVLNGSERDERTSTDSNQRYFVKWISDRYHDARWVISGLGKEVSNYDSDSFTTAMLVHWYSEHSGFLFRSPLVSAHQWNNILIARSGIQMNRHNNEQLQQVYGGVRHGKFINSQSVNTETHQLQKYGPFSIQSSGNLLLNPTADVDPHVGDGAGLIQLVGVGDADYSAVPESTIATDYPNGFFLTFTQSPQLNQETKEAESGNDQYTSYPVQVHRDLTGNVKFQQPHLRMSYSSPPIITTTLNNSDYVSPQTLYQYQKDTPVFRFAMDDACTLGLNGHACF